MHSNTNVALYKPQDTFIRFILLLFFSGIRFAGVTGHAADLFVSPTAPQPSQGSQEHPFRSLRKALQRAKPGDTIWLREGRYEEPIKLFEKSQLEIRPHNNENVIIDGTVELPTAWKPWRNGIWKQILSFTPHQLFCDDSLVHVARWPNATFKNGSIWRMMEGMRSADGGWNKHKNKWDGKTRFGKLYDDGFSRPETPGFREGDSRYQVDPTIRFDRQSPPLADTKKDFTGCVAVLNIGHWKTWARSITQHASGQDHFSYNTTGLVPEQIHQFSGYYILGLAALDHPNEWWFDADTKTMYYMPPTGIDPNIQNLRGRTKDVGIDLLRCTEISIRDLTFHAAGFFLKDCSDSTVRDCRFNFPATHRFMDNEFQFFQSYNPQTNRNVMPSFFGGKRNIFSNNTVRWCNSPIHLGSDEMVVENCLFSDIEWDVNSDGGSGAVMIGKNSIFRRNTVTRCGNSEGVRAVDEGVTLDFNHLSDMSNLQHDGSALNVGTTKHYKTLVSHNWAHDCNRQGIRFDYHGSGIYREDGEVYGDGAYMNNVTWNTTDNEIKGDRQLILNNTVLRNNHYPDVFQEEVTLSVQGFKVMHEIYSNANSLIRNNLGTLRSRSFHLSSEPQPWWKRSDGSVMPVATILPGTADHNMREKGASWRYLRDPANYDFRPRAGSPLVDAGALVTEDELPSPVTQFPGQHYVGAAPDIGAYECHDSRYWIPGRLESTATIPVPKNKGVNVPLDTDLMFLEAYQATAHTIYFGRDANDLKPIASLKGTTTNIVQPPKLNARTTYYWRVGAAKEAGTEVLSPTWTFTTRE